MTPRTGPQPGDLEIPSDDLRVGDVIAGVRRHDHDNVSWLPYPESVLAIENPRITVLRRGGAHTFDRGTLIELLTVRARGPARAPVDYPSHCTRCGAPAYVGLHEVAHQDEEAARGCPARRA